MARTRTVLGVVAVMAAVLVAFATPAMADDWDDWEWNDRHHDDDVCWFLGVWVCDDDDRDRFDFDDGFFFGDNEQEAESGDIDQSFDVSGTGDNSNQTVGTQGVANTGNAQNQLGVFQIGSEATTSSSMTRFFDRGEPHDHDVERPGGQPSSFGLPLKEPPAKERVHSTRGPGHHRFGPLLIPELPLSFREHLSGNPIDRCYALYPANCS
jgi:hypothetical protein